MDINKLLEDVENINMDEYSSLEECLKENVTISNDDYPYEYVDVTHRICQRWVYAHGVNDEVRRIIDDMGYNEGLNYWLQDMEVV